LAFLPCLAVGAQQHHEKHKRRLNMASQHQTQEEKFVFRMFAEVCPLQIRRKTIQNRPPPEADFLCQVVPEGRVAFELVEVVDKGIARQSSDTGALHRVFNEACQELGRNTIGNLENAIVHVTYVSAASLEARRRALVQLVKQLVKLSPTLEGTAPISGHLTKAIKKATIHRGNLVGPIYDDSSALAFSEPALDAVKGKFSKEYESSAPIELVAFYSIQPVLPKSHWVPAVQRYVKKNLGASPFRRVWVFDCTSKSILLTYPQVGSTEMRAEDGTR
jgi:hypothetical protein